MSNEFFQTGHGRVFIQLLGANPGNAMSYMGRGRLGGFNKSDGEVTPARNPSPHAYDQFIDVDEVKGEEGRPTTSLIARFGLTNELMTISCPFHVQAHYGRCADPTDQNGGWEKIIAYDHAFITTRSSDDMTAMEPGERAMITITAEITARTMWDVDQMNLEESADDEVTDEVIDVMVADYLSCGDCGYESDGSKRIFAVAAGPGTASPSVSPVLLASYDGGSTWDAHDISSMADGEVPTGLFVTGGRIIVTVNTAASIHVAELTDLDTWTESDATTANGLNAIWASGASHIWMAADGGYVYFTARPATEVDIQSAGSLTTENLNAIHGVSDLHVVAVGDAGAIIHTANGGRTWSLASTSPGGVGNIQTVWMRSPYTWIIGDDAGQMFYTRDAGNTWHSLYFPLDGLGSVNSIVFANYHDSPFGFMVATNAAGKGFIFRKLDGGETWYQLPDFANSTPDNTGLNAVTAGVSPNFCVAVGEKATGGDGIVLIGG